MYLMKCQWDWLQSEAKNYNTIEELTKASDGILTINMAKVMIAIEDHEFLKHIKPNGYEITLKMISDVEDIKDVEILAIQEDDHELCTKLTFIDEKGQLRYGFIGWNPFGPGMCEYYHESETAKKDLIAEINQTYAYERENQEDND